MMNLKFDEMKVHANEMLENIKEEKLEIEKKLKEINDLESKWIEKNNYVAMIESMAGSSRKFYEWTCESNDERTKWNNTIKRYEYKTGLKEFNIRIAFRDDLKKWKYEVHVSGKKDSLNKEMRYNFGGYNTYSDHDYIKRFYMDWKQCDKTKSWKWFDREGINLSEKFTSLAAAEKWVKEWQDRLIKDHEEEIKKEKTHYDQAKSEFTKGNKIVLYTDDFNTRSALLEMIDLLPNLKDKKFKDRFRDTIQLEGEGIAATIKHIIEQYKMNVRVLAG